VWIVLDRGASSVCMQHPGFDTDVLVTCTTPGLADVFSGRTSWNRAVDSGSITLEGAPRLTRAFPR